MINKRSKTSGLGLLWMFIICSMLITQQSVAQSAAAELHFESAEKAFNAGDYLEAIRKLDDAEKISGTMSKTLYLRIVSQDKALDAWLFVEPGDRHRVLEEIKENAQAYLEVMESAGLDDRFREIFTLSEKYKDYSEPDHSEGYQLLVEKKAHVDFMTSYVYGDDTRFMALYPTGVYKDLFIEPIYTKVLYDDVDKLIWRWNATYEGKSYFFEFSKESAIKNKAAHETWLKYLAIALSTKKPSKEQKSFMEQLDYTFLQDMAKDVDGSYLDGMHIVEVDANGNTKETIRANDGVYTKQQYVFANGTVVESFACSGVPYMDLVENGKTIGVFHFNDDGSMPPEEKKRWESMMTKYANY